MPPAAKPSPWDFLTLVAWWNLAGLPALLCLVTLTLVIRQRLRAAAPQLVGLAAKIAPPRSALTPRTVAVRIIALIHSALGLRAGVWLAQEVLSMRAQGIPQSGPLRGIILPIILIIVNLTIGYGLWRLWRWARLGAIAWDALVVIVTTVIMLWQWRFHAPVRLDQWPDYVVADALPWFLLVVMLLPGTRDLFTGTKPRPARSGPAAAGWRASWPSPVFLSALLLLLVAVSTLVVDLIEWVERPMEDAAG
jgi:hypothetical protein